MLEELGTTKVKVFASKYSTVIAAAFVVVSSIIAFWWLS